MESILIVSAPYAFIVLLVVVMVALAFSKPAVLKLHEQTAANSAARRETFKNVVRTSVYETTQEIARPAKKAAGVH